MKITFLGTGTSQGVPIINCDCPVCKSLDFRDKRLRCSVHIEVNGKSIVIDTGPDFRQQVLRESIHQLDAILLTHEHKDHIAGLDDVRGYNFSLNKNIPIYARQRVIDRLKVEFPYAFAEDYAGRPRIDTIPISNQAFLFEDLEIVPIDGMHGGMPCFGFRIENFTYITDMNELPEKEWDKIAGSKVLVLNALHHKDHYSHFTLKEALDLAKKLSIPKTYFVHMSHHMGLHGQVDSGLPMGIHLAYDGLKIEI
ncbi:MBL fold metallo-hydrolase [Persicobacter diffluens]|uniref:MBL fold metallo-hydrolase n=1 Tax=Persicobacter diffluens TaxID=981 RepID=A0AAN4VUT3_9BACT|nr:MBL fold metallo-hydrolase [Persicobacter diffluens]